MPEIFGALTDMRFDFSDLKLKTAGVPMMAVSQEMQDIIRDACDCVEPEWDKLGEFDIAQNTQDQIANALG